LPRIKTRNFIFQRGQSNSQKVFSWVLNQPLIDTHKRFCALENRADFLHFFIGKVAVADFLKKTH